MREAITLHLGKKNIDSNASEYEMLKRIHRIGRREEEEDVKSRIWMDGLLDTV